MSEIEIFKQLAEGLGIGALIVIASAWLLSKGIVVFRESSHQSFEREKLRIENEREDRAQRNQAQGDLTSAVKYLADKTETVTKSQEETARILATLKDETKGAIEATHTAQNTITSKIDDTQRVIETAIRDQTQGIGALVDTVTQLQALLTEYHTTHEKSLQDTITGKLDEVVSLFQVQINSLENKIIHLFNERIKNEKTHSNGRDVSHPDEHADIGTRDGASPPHGTT